MSFAIGLDRLAAQDFASLKGKKLGVVCNQASVDSSYRHILGLLEKSPNATIGAVFGPQHGLFGTTQDNMIEWNGEGAPPKPYPTNSLYGEHREPTDEMLEGLDLILVDLPDIGSRYYTFVWTMSLCVKAAERLRIPVLVLDRPNPIGSAVEGPGIAAGFESFVGLHSVPIRHGMTIGEIGRHVVARHYPKARLEVVPTDGGLYADQMPYAWVMPSPNMPTVDTAVVYPGACLLEATNLSEGRGTTRPFEIVGAPFIHGQRLADSLNSLNLEGVFFRPLQFEPTFNKHQGKICEGVQVHVLDRFAFRPVLAYSCLINEVAKQTGIHDSSHVKLDRFQATSDETQLPGFAWKQPPYEYVHDRMPIDILSGSEEFRKLVETGASLVELEAWSLG